MWFNLGPHVPSAQPDNRPVRPLVSLQTTLFNVWLCRLYDALKRRYNTTSPGNINERIPFVESPDFSDMHHNFGQPVNDWDMFHGERGVLAER
jgi:hypothetical protein